MSALQPLQLSRLRDIGWAYWDPLGLLAKGKSWDSEPFADEYDSYLLKLADDLRGGSSAAEAVAYLIQVESEHMGPDARRDICARAEATVSAMQAYLISTRG
jgi:hypothetical protein